jgi:thioesterase domain-containing protein
MVPTAYVPLDEMPMTPNGKLDRKSLPAPEAGSVASRAYEPPQGEIEATLARVWNDVLRVERIGRHDNFFEIGGHSLLAALLMAKTNRRFKQTLPLAALFTAPNIAALAKLISSEEAPSFDILVPIETSGDAPPVFAVPGVGGNVLSLRPLSKVLGPNQPFFGLQAVGLDGKRPPLDSVEQTAQVNIAALKTIQPGGPYSLIGHSYGGVVAYEMARILLEQGEGVSSLILLDSIAPAIMQRNLAHDEVAELVEASMAAADIYGARPEIDVERLLRLSDDEKVHYLAGLLNDCGLEIDCGQFAAFYRVYRANLLCYRAYTPPSLSREIDVSLYRATEGRQDRLNLPHDYGWGRLLQRSIRIYDVEANHFSILKKVAITQ